MKLNPQSVPAKKLCNMQVYISCAITETHSRELYCVLLYFKLILRSGPRLKTVKSGQKRRKGRSVHSRERPWGGEARGCHSPGSAERSTSPGHRTRPAAAERRSARRAPAGAARGSAADAGAAQPDPQLGVSTSRWHSSPECRFLGEVGGCRRLSHPGLVLQRTRSSSAHRPSPARGHSAARPPGRPHSPAGRPPRPPRGAVPPIGREEGAGARPLRSAAPLAGVTALRPPIGCRRRQAAAARAVPARRRPPLAPSLPAGEGVRERRRRRRGAGGPSVSSCLLPPGQLLNAARGAGSLRRRVGRWRPLGN